MGRKRLLTILAGAVAAVGLHMGPAVALDLEADLGDTKVSVKADLLDGVDAAIVKECEDEKTAKLLEQCIEDAEASLSASKDDGVKAKAGDTEVKTKDVTEPVEKTTEKATEKVTTGGDESSSPTEERSSSGGSSDGGSQETSTGGSSSDSGDVSTAGGAQSVDQPSERPDALSPEEARQFLASSRESMDLSDSGGDVSPAFGFSSGGFGGDLDDPLVASPGAVPSEDTADGEWHAASPETAPSRSDAELAAIPTSGSDVPAGLKLIAGLLVAGTGTLWHLTRRELQPVKA